MSNIVFLTGATGALGPIIAAELLASGTAGRLNLLIRPGATSTAGRFETWIQSLEAAMAASGALLPNPRRRVAAIEGDLCGDHLGLSPSAREQLCDETEVIIHAAADTNFRGQSHFQTNVEGTRRLLALARSCRRLKKFIFVSTICAAGRSDGIVPETPIHDRPEFANPYEQSKWEAEQWVLKSDLPIEIIRVGVVMGSSITGAVYRLGALQHTMKWFGSGQMPTIPGRPNTPVDLIDSELPARLICKAAAAPLQQHAIYHASAGWRAVLLRDLCPFLAMQMRETIHDNRPWSLSQHGPTSRVQERLAKTWLPVLLSGRTYDTTRAEALWGGPLPLSDWRTTLEKVIHFCGYRVTRRASVG